MKKMIVVGLVLGAAVFANSSVNAKIDNDAIVQTDSLSKLTTMLNTATPETSSEELQSNLVSAIEQICKNTGTINSDSTVSAEVCSAEQLDFIMNSVISAIGTDSPFIPVFLSALVEAGVSDDAVTLAAITAGVDATIASQATAAGATSAGPVQASAGPVVVDLPTTTLPIGAGGTGGDSGISEVGN